MSGLIDELNQFLNFKMMSRIHKLNIFKGIKVVNFIRNQVLYEEREESDSIYFILEGEYEVSKSFSVNRDVTNLQVDFATMNPSDDFKEKLEVVGRFNLNSL